MLKINNLTKLYDGVHGVQNINLHVPAGSIYGIIGHNGAGKTTLIKMVTGILKPDSVSSCTNDIEPNGASSLVQLLAKKI